MAKKILKTKNSKPVKKSNTKVRKKTSSKKPKNRANKNFFDETQYAPPPRPATRDQAIERFGHERIDRYFWLRQKENPETIQYLHDENKYIDLVTKPLKSTKDKLFKEMKSFFPDVDEAVPYRLNGYIYQTKYAKNHQHPVLSRKPVDGKKSFTTILDANKLAKGLKSFSLGGAKVSPNNLMLAYSMDTHGAEEYTIHVRDLNLMKDLKIEVNKATGSIQWDEFSESIFFIELDDEHRGRWVRRFHLSSQKMETIYELKSKTNFVSINKTLSGRYLVIDEADRTSSEVHYLDLQDRHGQLLCMQKYKHDLMIHSVEHHGDFFYFISNRDNIEFDLFRARIQDYSADQWEIVRKSKPGETLTSHMVFAAAHVIDVRIAGLQKIFVRSIKHDGKKQGDAFGAEREIHFSQEIFSAQITGDNVDYETDHLRLRYSSLVQPSMRTAVNLQSLEVSVLKKAVIPRWFKPQDYQCERIMVKSHDGVRVPITIVYHKSTPLNGTAPTVMDGYGSYGMEMPVSFRVMAASLAKRGFVVAYAHIRGGGDLGEHWHRAAKLQAKKNTFYDFIACGEALIRKKISHPKKLIIRGGSAGGMLVGASMNMAPELFRMVVAHVPFVDVLNTMLDARLPLTPPEFKEWGNPDSSKEVYDYMKSYCPYTNVEAKNYPILYVTAGLHDPRVTYWEPAKWVAKLRELKKNKNVILFRTNMESGHAGASGRWDLLKELAEEVALEVLACADPG